MRPVCRSLAFLALLLLVTRDGLRGEDQKATPEQIEKAIGQLADKRFAVREKATKFLFEAGARAEKQLQEAAKSNDSDVASRAQSILENFAWGIYPDSDPKLKEHIESYKKGDAPTRLQSLESLLQIKPVPFRSLKKLVAMEENLELRRQQTARLAEYARNSIPDLIRDDKLDVVEETFELLLAGSGDDLAGDYAAFMHLRGRVDDGIARFEKLSEAKGEEGKNARQTLVYLYRIKRDWPKAAKYAATDSRPEVLEALHFESGDWKELLKRLPKEGTIEDMGFKLAVARLAQDGEEQEKLLKELRDPKEKVEADLETERVRQRAIALMMNHRAEEGIKLLIDSRTDLAMAFDLLVAQTRYKEAFALLEQAMKLEMDRNRKVGMQLHRARLLHLLGDKDSAIQLFNKYGPNAAGDDVNDMIQVLIRTEAKLGLKELACEHLGAYLAKVDENSRHASLESLLEDIFPSRGEPARSVWFLLREARPNEEHAKTATRLRNLMEGKGKEDLEVLAARAEKPPAAEPERRPDPPPVGKPFNQPPLVPPQAAGSVTLQQRILGLAELYEGHGQDENVRKFYRQAIDLKLPTAHLRFGHYLLGKARYDEAARAYEGEAASPTANNLTKTLALAMQGRCLRLLGKKKEGDVLVERAFWMPLANEYIRGELMREYRKRDWPEAARREAEMMLRTGELSNTPSFGALHYLANAAAREKDYARASDCYQRIAMGILRINGAFTEDSGYLAVPDAIEVARGQQLLKDGKVDEAVAIARASLKTMPGNVDTALAFVPALKKPEGDEIYACVRDVYLGILKDHPKSAFASNSLAWTMALCRRDLDDALKHAQNAVAFEPNHHGYLDTLAEVHFRRGEKEKAIELARKCIAMDSRRQYYRKQLERFETLGPDSEPPDENDD